LPAGNAPLARRLLLQPPVGSLKRFLYRATGEGGTRLDLLDNLAGEVDRLSTLAALLGAVEGIGGAAELLRDVADRMREILKREASRLLKNSVFEPS
jgi:hypothetical protein